MRSCSFVMLLELLLFVIWVGTEGLATPSSMGQHAADASEDALLGGARALELALRSGAAALREGARLRLAAAEARRADTAARRVAAERQRRSAAVRQRLAEAAGEDQRLRVEDTRLRTEAAQLRRAAAAAAAASATEEGTGSHHSTVALAIVGASLALGCLAFVGFEAYEVLYAHPSDMKIDLKDVKTAIHQRFLCGFSYKTLRSLCVLFLVGAAGFTFFWWKGMIQPILLNMLLYAYLAAVLLAILCITGAEAFADLSDRLRQVMKIVKTVEHFFNQGVEDVEDA